MSKATLYRIESGQGPVKKPIVQSLCLLYGVPSADADELAGLAIATQAPEWWGESYGSLVVPDWFGLYVGLEEAACSLRYYDPELVPGVVQTGAYARALIGSEATLGSDVVDQRVRFRLERQEKVLTADRQVFVLLGAGALSLVVGSTEILRAQIGHLVDLGRRGVAEVRVLPWSAGPDPIRGGFTLLDFATEEDPSVAYVELSMGARYIEQPEQLEQYQDAWVRLMRRSVSIEEWAA